MVLRQFISAVPGQPKIDRKSSAIGIYLIKLAGVISIRKSLLGVHCDGLSIGSS